jgi:DNA processing protein
MNNNSELLYRIALTLVPNIGPAIAKNLLAYCGSAEAVFKSSKTKLMKVPSVGEERAELIAKADIMNDAEAELKFLNDYHITPLFFTDAAYPYRLKECPDSPLLLYYKGNADLNTEKIVAIVGTRRCTDYGKEITRKITETLAEHHALIVSGLAYGIDIAAHHAALENNLQTVGVLGHGLNTIYPQQHKNTAKKMVEQGGLLTEYRSTQKMLPHNFPNRNRIVAGMCDAVIVIESAEDGGAILTANIANSYNRDVLAVPGKATDKWSRGCNALIKTNRAHLIENGEDLLKTLNWAKPETDGKKVKKQRELLLNLNEAEQKIYTILNEAGELDIDLLAFHTQLNNSVLAGVLLEMEMNDIIVSLPGKRYKLI